MEQTNAAKIKQKPSGRKKFDTSRLPMIIFSVIVIWFSLAFLIFPNITVLIETFYKDGHLTLTAFDRLSRSARAMSAIRNSLILGVVLSITVSVVGVFIVLVTEYYEVKFANILRVGYMTTLVFGGMMLNFGYLYVYGQKGVLTNLFASIFPAIDRGWFTGFPAVLFVMTFACTSNHMLFFRNAVKSLDFGTIEAAKNMGASQGMILRKIVLPTLKPTLLTLFIMAFQTGLGAMSAPLMVGGEFQTISPLILNFSKVPTSRDIAALLSVFLGITQILLLFVITRNEKKGNFLSISKTKTHINKQKIVNPITNVITHVVAYVLFLIYTIPLILVILFSFMDTSHITRGVLSVDGFTLEHYIKILTDADSYRPFLNSVIYSGLSAAAAVIAMVIVVRVIMKYRNKLTDILEYVFYIPWLLPSLLIALGIILAYDKPTFLMFGQILVGNPWVVPVAYFIVLIPYTLRYIKAAYYSFDQNLEDAAKNLGGRGLTILFKIILPVLLPTALALFALNFNGKLADYDLTAFLYHPTAPTLGIVIRQNAMGAENIDAQAINMVYSVILIVISTIVLYFVYGRGSDLASRRGGIKKKVKKPKNA